MKVLGYRRVPISKPSEKKNILAPGTSMCSLRSPMCYYERRNSVSWAPFFLPQIPIIHAHIIIIINLFPILPQNASRRWCVEDSIRRDMRVCGEGSDIVHTVLLRNIACFSLRFPGRDASKRRGSALLRQI